MDLFKRLSISSLKVFLQVILFLACTSFPSKLWSQNSSHYNAFSFKWLMTDYAWPVNFENFSPDNFTHGAILGYHRFLNSSLNFDLPIRFGYSRFPASDSTFGSRTPFIGSDFLLNYQFNNNYILDEEALLYPYIFAGIGVSYKQPELDQGFDFLTPFGLGINLRMFERAHFQIQAEFRRSVIREYHSVAYTLGFIMMLKENKNRHERAEIRKTQRLVDSDEDGIIDAIDECPFEPGSDLFNGCPDSDKDGTPDREDECPDESGPKSNKGCPFFDQDNDGIQDSEDECPDSPGSLAFSGCPDTDGDGIIDKLDNCPEMKGPANNQGCPIPDADKDGIPDTEDECPEIPGSRAASGCPDKDNDGILDSLDNCPNEAGLPINKGCPDADNDRIPDKEDKCPKQAGPANNDGCPVVQLNYKEYLEDASREIKFGSGNAELVESSKAVLDRIAIIFKLYPFYQIEIQGHTDNSGSAEDNLQLSTLRAEACKVYLTEKGIQPDRIISKGYGETKPKFSNTDAKGREQNRRVEFLLFLK